MTADRGDDRRVGRRRTTATAIGGAARHPLRGRFLVPAGRQFFRFFAEPAPPFTLTPGAGIPTTAAPPTASTNRKSLVTAYGHR